MIMIIPTLKIPKGTLMRKYNFFYSFQRIMAKSLRSKWKRKMRAIKRVRYGEKVSDCNVLQSI